MKVEFNTKTEKTCKIQCYYGIYLTNIDEENPILYDLEKDHYYKDVYMYDIEPIIGDVKLVVE